MLNFVLSLIIFFVCLNVSSAQWMPVNNGIDGIDVNCLAQKDNFLFAATSSGVYKSANNGNSWELSFKYTSRWIYIDDNKIFIGTWGDGVLLSTDNGLSWHKKSGGLKNQHICCIAKKGNLLIVGTDNGLFTSTDNGESWKEQKQGLTNTRIMSLLVKGDIIYAGTQNGLFQSSNDGQNWSSVGLSSLYIYALNTYEQYLFAGTSSGFYISTNNGMSWNKKNTGIWQSYPGIKSIFYHNGNLYAGSSSSDILYFSSNYGESWEQKKIGFRGWNYSVNSIIVTSNDIKIGIDYGGVFVSENSGNSWEQKNIGMQYTLANIIRIVFDGINIFAASANGVFTKNKSGNKWNRINDEQFKSVVSIASDKSNVFVATGDYGVFHTSDLGNNWTKINNGLPSEQSKYDIINISMNKNALFAGSNKYGMYKSTDGGNNWFAANSGLPKDFYIKISDISLKENDIYIATNFGLYKSTNNAESWVKINEKMPPTNCVFYDGINVCVGTGTAFTGNSRIFISNDNANTWSNYVVNSNDNLLYVIKTYNNFIFSAGLDGFFFSSDNGKSWIKRNEGLYTTSAVCFEIVDDYIYLGNLSGVYKAKISDIISGTSVDEIQKENEFLVFPNPANSFIEICAEFELPSYLELYNLQGKMIKKYSLNNNSNKATIYLDDIPPDVYILQIGNHINFILKE